MINNSDGIYLLKYSRKDGQRFIIINIKTDERTVVTTIDENKFYNMVDKLRSIDGRFVSIFEEYTFSIAGDTNGK